MITDLAVIGLIAIELWIGRKWCAYLLSQSQQP